MRFPPIERDDMTERQQEVAAEIAAGPRGALKGPFLVLIHNPELAAHLQSLGEHLRFGTDYSKTLIEIAILVTAHRWNCAYEWFAHSRIAREAGVHEDMVTAIAQGRRPAGMTADEALVHRFSVETAWDGRPGSEAMDLALERFGRPAVLDLIAIAGYYTLLAMVLNAADVAVPEHPITLPGEPVTRPPASSSTTSGAAQ